MIHTPVESQNRQRVTVSELAEALRGSLSASVDCHHHQSVSPCRGVSVLALTSVARNYLRETIDEHFSVFGLQHSPHVAKLLVSLLSDSHVELLPGPWTPPMLEKLNSPWSIYAQSLKYTKLFRKFPMDPLWWIP